MTDATISATRVALYYDRTIHWYKIFWHGETAAIHYGFRDATTRSLHDELLNTNQVLADAADVRPGDRILDAGCGVGGSAVWLARHRGVSVVGLTVSRRQLEQAQQNARAGNVERRVTFQIGDYARSGLDSAAFDVVWALESSCYAPDKGDFLTEAYRLLRPGGRLVVGDGFLRRHLADSKEEREYTWFRRGLVLPEIPLITDFEAEMRRHGFRDVRTWDKTDAALPSGRRLHRRCSAAYPFAKMGAALGIGSSLLADNVRAGIAQYRMIRSGLIGYNVVVGRKPADHSQSIAP